MQNVSDIIKWYKKNFRDLPWRTTNDAYKIWLAEVILQQTQIVQGLDYYYKFVAEYPDIASLANADEETVLKLWQGLGYYSRARNMLKTARLIVDEYHGKFPLNKQILMSLPGIGDYTSSAILSFSFNLPYPTLDGNVFRVLSRYFNIEEPIDKPQTRKIFQDILQAMIEQADPRIFNNAMMELGAIVCKPNQPDCENCPLSVDCQARILNKINLLPVKSKKIQKRTRFFNYLFIKHKEEFFIRKRIEKDIWVNLFELPLIETDAKAGAQTLSIKVYEKYPELTNLNMIKQVSLKHILTHQVLEIQFWRIDLPDESIFNPEACLRVDADSYTKYALPVPINKFLLSL